jgi:hypothetical protein
MYLYPRRCLFLLVSLHGTLKHTSIAWSLRLRMHYMHCILFLDYHFRIPDLAAKHTVYQFEHFIPTLPVNLQGIEAGVVDGPFIF